MNRRSRCRLVIFLFALFALTSLLPACAPAQVVRETVVVVVTPTSVPVDAPTVTMTDVSIPTITTAPPATTKAVALQPVTQTATRTIPPPTATRAATATITPPAVKIALFDGGVNVTQTAPNTTDPTVTTALVFQADVSLDTSRIKDTLANVDMRVIDAHNQTAYQHTENNEPFCMFSDSNGNCNSWVFRNHSNAWPNNRPVQRGSYFLRALGIAASGRTRAGEMAIYIDPRPNGEDSPVQVQIVQIAPNSDADVASNEIVFQAEAFDSRKGNSDGKGIDHVDLTIVDQLGNIVHEHTEKTAKYCAFGGGEPDCTIWNFSAHNNRWDTGIPVYVNTQYFLRAVAYAADGTTGAAVAQVMFGQ